MSPIIRVLSVVSVIACASGCATHSAARGVAVPPNSHAESHLLGPVNAPGGCRTPSAAGCEKASLFNVYYIVRN